MSVDQREKFLIKNTGILALGTICSKVFAFFLLPLYTHVLTTQDFGTIDVLQNLLPLIMPFVTLELSQALFRFIVDKSKKEDYAQVISSALLIEFLNILVASLIIYIAHFFLPLPHVKLFIPYMAAYACMEMCQNIARGFQNNALYAVMNFAMTFVSVIANLLFILAFKLKGESILIASTLSYFSVFLLGFFKLRLWQYLRLSAFEWKTLKQMLAYSLPLIPNTISWWITNASDRFIILTYLGTSFNGIYSAAQKTTGIYSTVFNAFNIAWMEVLSRHLNDATHIDFINAMFEKNIKFFSCVILLIISGMSLIFRFIIAKAYAAAYGQVYVLLVGVFIYSIYIMLSSIFIAYKKSDKISMATVCGAVVNFILNLMLVPYIGLYAASISSVVAYVVNALMLTFFLKRFLKLKWPLKYLMQFALLFALVSFGFFFKNTLLNAVIFVVVAIWSVFINKTLLSNILSPIFNKLKSY